MIEDHEAIDELLAGYALQTLEGSDAAEADRLLVEHVPGCDRCAETLRAFIAVAAELGLATAPVSPPETLLRSMRRELRRGDQRAGIRWNPARLAAVAASLVVVVGLAGVALTRDTGPDTTVLAATSDIRGALDIAARPDAESTPVGPMTEVAAPGTDVHLWGQDVPPPPPGYVYRLWATSPTEVAYLGDFPPLPSGPVVIRVTVDTSRYDGLLVTVEPAGSTPSEPGDPAWDAA